MAATMDGYQRFELVRQYSAHRNRIKKMKPFVDTSKPRTMGLMDRPDVKKELMEEQRRKLIEQNNKILEEALTKVSKGKAADNEQVKHHDRIGKQMQRFHQEGRDMHARRIAEENERYAKGVMRYRVHIESEYSQNHTLMAPPKRFLRKGGKVMIMDTSRPGSSRPSSSARGTPSSARSSRPNTPNNTPASRAPSMDGTPRALNLMRLERLSTDEPTSPLTPGNPVAWTPEASPERERVVLGPDSEITPIQLGRLSSANADTRPKTSPGAIYPRTSESPPTSAATTGRINRITPETHVKVNLYHPSGKLKNTLVLQKSIDASSMKAEELRRETHRLKRLWTSLI